MPNASKVKVNHGFMVCEECTFALVNGDYPNDEERAQAILAGEKRELPARWCSDSKEGEEGTFSSRECSCCRTHLAGNRYPFALVTHS